MALVIVLALLLFPSSESGSSRAAEGGDLSPETLAARQLFFGAEHVDTETGALPRGELHLSWVSVATFAAAIDGHVVLFDAYIHKEEDEPNYVPAVTQDLIDLHPEYIIIGHGHFDHALDAGTIAVATGATIVGTRSHCDEAEAFGGGPVECIIAFEEGAQFGDTVELSLWDGVCTTAILHPHSASEPLDPDHDPANTVVPIPDPGSALLHPPGSLFGTEGDEGGTVLYQLRVGSFGLVYHDSSGPLPEQAPQLPEILAGLPNTDVHVGAILGFNQILNGLRDPAMYVAAIAPQVFVPNHHDFVTEYGSADDFEPVLLREFEDYGASPELRFLYDPYDYVRPNLLSFDLDAPRWVLADDEVCPPSAAELAAGGERQSGLKSPLPATGAGAILGAGLVLAAIGIARRRP